jgi:hypothetical protein
MSAVSDGVVGSSSIVEVPEGGMAFIKRCEPPGKLDVAHVHQRGAIVEVIESAADDMLDLVFDSVDNGAGISRPIPRMGFLRFWALEDDDIRGGRWCGLVIS